MCSPKLLANLILLLVIGCARYHPKPLVPAATLSAFMSRSLEDPCLAQFAVMNGCTPIECWPPAAWGLDELALAAFYYHPSLDVARSAWQVATAGIVTAAMRPNPSFAFIPQYNKEPSVGGSGLTPQQTGATSPWTFNQLLTIPIETAGKREIRIAKAQRLAAASRCNVCEAGWLVRSGVRKALLDLYSASRLEQLLGEQVATQERLVRSLTRHKSEGEIASPDLNWATIGLQLTVVSLKEMQKQRAESLALLADRMGVPLAAIACIPFCFGRFEFLASPEMASLSVCKSCALLNRSDLLVLLQEYAASEQDLRLEIAKQIPDLYLGPGYNWDQGTQEWLLGFAANLPIMNQNQGPIAEACARRKEAAQLFRALQASIIGEVEWSLSGYYAVLEKLKSAGSLLESQEEQYRYASELFAAGEMDQIFYLTAKSNYLSASQLYFNVVVEAQQSLGALEDGLQCPLELDLALKEIVCP